MFFKTNFFFFFLKNRFWHTRSGTFLKKLDVKGQVTSVIWSRHKRQLVATFGFHDAENPILLAVYAFPQSEIIGRRNPYYSGKKVVTQYSNNDNESGGGGGDGNDDGNADGIGNGNDNDNDDDNTDNNNNNNQHLNPHPHHNFDTGGRTIGVTGIGSQQRNSFNISSLSFNPTNTTSFGSQITSSNSTRRNLGPVSHMPRLRNIGELRWGAGGMGYNPRPLPSGSGAGAMLLRYRHGIQNPGRGRGGIISGTTNNGNGNNNGNNNTNNNNNSNNGNNNSNGNGNGCNNSRNNRGGINRSRRRRANQPLIQVPTPSGLRVLSATASPDGTCICVATNDETVRFFKLWSADEPKVPMSMCQSIYQPNTRVLESNLIEFKEGIENIDEIIR